MLGTVVDTALGLVFCYFLLSLIVSGVQELLASLFAWRGTYLSKGIGVILDDAPDAAFGWAGIGEFLRAHFTSDAAPTAVERLAKDPGTAPAGASPEQVAALRKVLSVQSHPLLRGTPTRLPSYVPARQFALALLEVLGDGSHAPFFTQAEKTVGALPNGDLKRTLSLFLAQAGGDIDRFRAHLEAWFDDAMDRLSGIYARLSRYTLLILGLILAMTLNVDSLRLARTLWLNQDMRAALVADAALSASGPVPASSASGPAPASAPTPAVAEATIRQAWISLESQDLPLGWSAGNWPPGTLDRLFALCGWALTAVAVGLGAPFWFSLLQQIGSLRGGGPPPARGTAPPP